MRMHVPKQYYRSEGPVDEVEAKIASAVHSPPIAEVLLQWIFIPLHDVPGHKWWTQVGVSQIYAEHTQILTAHILPPQPTSGSSEPPIFTGYPTGIRLTQSKFSIKEQAATGQGVTDYRFPLNVR